MNFLKQAERRHFLGVVGAAALLGAVPSLAQTRKGTPGASASSSFKPDLELELRAEPALVPIWPGPPTSVWRYRANVLKGDAQAVTNPASGYLGPIIRVHRGTRVRIHFVNQLPQPSVVHWHGLIVPEE